MHIENVHNIDGLQPVLIAARPSVEMSPHKSALDILSLLKRCKNNSVSSSLINTFITAVQHFPSDAETNHSMKISVTAQST